MNEGWNFGYQVTYWNSGESDNSKKFEISERNENSGSDFQKVCVEEMQKGNVNGALKLLTDNMDHRILPLNDDTISKPKMKHPQASAPDPIILLPDEAQNIHPIRYEDITAEKVDKAAINTNRSDLCRATASFTRKLCLEKLDASSLEALLACLLIPLDKKTRTTSNRSR